MPRGRPFVAVKPFLKWVGSKRALVPEILARLPRRIETYREPFLGGGAVFFALAAERRFKTACLSDVNVELVRTYRALRDCVDVVILRLKQHRYNEREYYDARALDPDEMTDAECASRFIYLNRTGFNGLYRVNAKGKFNVPWGRYDNPLICDEDNLRAVSRVLQGVRLDIERFGFNIVKAKRGDAVYCDPPYWPASKTSNFTSYSADRFDSYQQEILEQEALSADWRGAVVVLSNADVPPVRELYCQWRLESVSRSGRMSSKGSGRQRVGELLITRAKEQP